MLSRIYTASLLGLDARIIEVEVDIQKGLHKFNIVGLPDKAVNESKERVTAAIKNSKCEFISRRITVNLAPADIPKSGPIYDFPIAVGILLASGQIDFNPTETLILGELSLEGKLRGINGMLSIASDSLKHGFKKLFVPEINAEEASLVKNIEVFPVKTINQFIEHTANLKKISAKNTSMFLLENNCIFENDLSEVKGQHQAKRALEITAAGGHNLIMTGTPGSGKTFLAKTFKTILPNLTPNESLEITRVHSVIGNVSSKNPLISARPFRNPHHTSSEVALVGGGTYPRPGEVSLAHRGVLFLDEFPEFSRAALEALRQPIEDKMVTISRATCSIQYPANFILIAAMNPCKCGWRGDPDKECVCTTTEYLNYKKRISGPILDRIDLQIYVPKVKYESLISKNDNETSESVRKRVQTARNIQLERYSKQEFMCNADINQQLLRKYVVLDEESEKLIHNAVDKFNLSARSYFRILRVSRTIADLESSEKVKSVHVSEALSYRISD